MHSERYPENLGFRAGNKGTHTSRTLMLDELRLLIAAVPPDGSRADYLSAGVEHNVLGKQTVATRKLTVQRISELYALDPSVPLFRVLRFVWFQETEGRPLLALLCAMARDPLLRACAGAVLGMRVGEELSRQTISDALRSVVVDRLNDSTLDKVVRNVSSSWCQSGHLEGRVRKFRRQVRPTPGATVYALVLGYLQGLRGARLLASEWIQVLDVNPDELRQLVMEARRRGLLDLKIAGEIIEIGFSTLLTTKEILNSRGTH